MKILFMFFILLVVVGCGGKSSPVQYEEPSSSSSRNIPKSSSVPNVFNLQFNTYIDSSNIKIKVLLGNKSSQIVNIESINYILYNSLDGIVENIGMIDFSTDDIMSNEKSRFTVVIKYKEDISKIKFKINIRSNGVVHTEIFFGII